MTVQETASKIKSLEIQGATNIAVQAVKALGEELRKHEWSTSADVYKLITTSMKLLIESRATEPMMRNGLKYIDNQIHEANWSNEMGFRKLVQDAENHILEVFTEAKNKMIDVGAKRIENGDTVLTHCHSSGVTGTIIKAKEQGKEFKVIQTETRPRYQGRITAKELVKQELTQL